MEKGRVQKSAGGILVVKIPINQLFGHKIILKFTYLEIQTKSRGLALKVRLSYNNDENKTTK